MYLGPIYVIVEFAPHGNLRDFLKENRPPGSATEAPETSQARPVRELNEKNLISFADQIARGMQYLSENKVLPSDVTAGVAAASDVMTCSSIL